MPWKPKKETEEQHYLISPYKSLRFLYITNHVKQEFTILVTT